MIEIWILTVCTNGWVMCSEQFDVEYKSEDQCYRALNTLYDRQGESSFNWITCKQKPEIKP